MKFAKLSIAAIAVLGLTSSAVAADKNNITFNPFGSAKLWYETKSVDGVEGSKGDLFNKGNASGQALISGGATGKINSCFGYGFEAMAVNTLGLESNVVSDVRVAGERNDEGDALDAKFWFPQAYLTYHPCDMGTNTTFKIGRQYLDTPLAFTENWNVAPNSFDAIVALNQDIINTTIVGAYVGRGNGVFGRVTNTDDFRQYGSVSSPKGIAGVPNVTNGNPTNVGITGEGAYALGVITSLLDGALPISLWGYDVVNVAQAFWGDAGYKLDLGDGMKFDLGAQYGAIMPDDDTLAGVDDSSGFGVKIGGGLNVADMNFGLTLAYSSVDDDGLVPLANTATEFKKTKLYTAGIYTDGTHVAQPGSDAFKVKATTKLAGIGGLALQYVHNENDNHNTLDVDEIDVILSTGILPGGLNTKLIYINRDYDQDSVADSDHVRVILSKKF
jgi:hypothetical protein